MATITIDGKEYPFLAKDELERALPVLKKAYLKYNEVAGKTVQYMFYDLFKDYTELEGERKFIKNERDGLIRDQRQLKEFYEKELSERFPTDQKYFTLMFNTFTK